MEGNGIGVSISSRDKRGVVAMHYLALSRPHFLIIFYFLKFAVKPSFDVPEPIPVPQENPQKYNRYYYY